VKFNTLASSISLGIACGLGMATPMQFHNEWAAAGIIFGLHGIGNALLAIANRERPKP
jgi:hypothetical protein